MDLLDFFEEACLRSRPGDVVALPEDVGASWLHVDALAQRLGFVRVDSVGRSWRNERSHQSPVIRWLCKDDFADWLALFVACFGHGISAEQWAWKYRDAPKPGVAVVLQGRMIAFYGGMPRDVVWAGKTYAGIQVGDVMVHPEFRGGLTRKGPFQMVASTFLEQTLAADAPYWIGFGFPNQRAMQVARRLHLYRPVNQLAELFWPPRARALPWWLGYSPVRPGQLGFVDGLWRDMRHAMQQSLMGVRDAHHVQMRYLAHPSHVYAVLKVFHVLTRQVYGLLVMRQLSDGRQEILDVIGHPRHFSKLVMVAQFDAGRAASPSVSAWITESHVHWLKSAEAQVQALDVQIPTNDWVDGNLNLEPSGRWWLTSGDTDFR